METLIANLRASKAALEMKVTTYYKESLVFDSEKKSDAKKLKEKYGIKEKEMFGLMEDAVAAHGKVGMSTQLTPRHARHVIHINVYWCSPRHPS
jgi:hypothetical protein